MNKEINKYFVIFNRHYGALHVNQYGAGFLPKEAEDNVMIMDREEAIRNNWIDKDGSRVWVEPVGEERGTVTFVFGFQTLAEACVFHDSIRNEVGMHVHVMI